MSKFLLICWSVLAVVVFVYSYGFVDLNLTLSANPIIFNFVTWSQHLVYFDRTLSLKVFILLVCLMFVSYLYALKLTKFPWKLVITISLIFALSYPMLSSDVFKYLFGAREILVYHANPYLITPNTFRDDTWIRFMRWVHTTTPYGPVFTLYTIPFYIAGFGKFIPVLYLYKVGNLAWYLLAIWLIGKLKDVRAQLFFALNPLVIMEWLVNSHNDAIMITLLLLSLYLYTLKKRAWSFVSLLASIGVKYITVIFLPFVLLRKKIPLNSILYTLYFILLLAPLLYNYSWQYQPWYVTWLVPVAAMISHRLIRVGVVAYCLGAFLRYIPFVATGVWSATPFQFALLTFAPPLLVLAGNLVYNGIHAVVSKA